MELLEKLTKPIAFGDDMGNHAVLRLHHLGLRGPRDQVVAKPDVERVESEHPA
jgi:hypothetical protein